MGWGPRDLRLGDPQKPRSARRGLLEAGDGRVWAKTKKSGAEASRRDRTSRFPPPPRGSPTCALKAVARSPAAVAQPLVAPVREQPPGAAPEP